MLIHFIWKTHLAVIAKNHKPFVNSGMVQPTTWVTTSGVNVMCNACPLVKNVDKK